MERTADGRIRTTEWEDVQYKHGNKVGKYVTHETELLMQRVADANPNIALRVYDPNEEKVRDKLARGGYDVDPTTQDEGDVTAASAEVGGDEDDDDALAAFRRKRLCELQQEAQTHVYGSVRHIRGTDYVKEITEASKSCWVVGVMTSHGHEGCDVLLRVLIHVASRHRQVKFVSLLAEEAVAKMPSKMLPCVIVYHNGQLVTQFTELTPWMDGKDVTTTSVERVLGRVGVIEREEVDEDEEQDEKAGELARRIDLRSGAALRHK